MPQTILAMLAMMIAMLFAFNQQQSTIQMHMKQIQNEISILGTGVAEDVLAEVGQMSFDREVARLDDGEKLTSANQLTHQPFERRAPVRGLEDFHGVERTVHRTIHVTDQPEPDTLNFRTEIEVSYVNLSDMESEVTGPTKAKKVTVSIESMDINHPRPIRLSRSYTCGSRCDW